MHQSRRDEGSRSGASRRRCARPRASMSFGSTPWSTSTPRPGSTDGVVTRARGTRRAPRRRGRRAPRPRRPTSPVAGPRRPRPETRRRRVAVARGETAHVDDAGDPVGPCVDRSVGDRAAGGVPDEHDLAVNRVDGVDHRDDRVDVVAQGDHGAVGVLRLHAGQRDRVRAVPRGRERRPPTTIRRASDRGSRRCRCS